ncbi:MAG: AMP-binding protein, partial [Bacteroidetes bacterium]|nr:AMP-binding protein [Bacteroidota bacterium]
RIYAAESSIIGSIGVVSGGFGFAEAIKRLGIERRLHTAGEKKAMLDPFRPEKPSDIKHLKSLQKDIHESFEAMVRERRGDRLKGKQKELFSGAFWTGTRALEMGLIDGIGATEVLHIFISATEEDMRPGATGKPIPGYEAMVVDQQGNRVPPGTIGLLAVRGPTGCRYLDDEARQQRYVRHGWNYTGDAYLVDDDGYFHFQARADDMIISSGYNISGIEVETALLKHPAVKECGVVGAPDPARGHLVKAYVVLRNPDDACDELVKELQDFVKAEIAPYKYPRAIAFRDDLPRTQTGKVQRFKLREDAAS